jgi:protein-S-isoprenylcysteine O-methyltransferase Ste14
MRKITKSVWGTPKKFAAMGLIAIGGYFLFIELRQPVFEALICLLPGASLMVIVFLRLARHEERLAKQESGPAYLDYLQRTPVRIPTFSPTSAELKIYLTCM